MEPDELEADGLSADEQAYFDSKGEAPAPTPEVSAEPAPKPETPAPEKKGDVSVAIRQEREENRRLKADMDALRERAAILEDRWNRALQPQQPVEEIPDPDKDIFAFTKYQQEKIAALEQRLTQGDQQAAEAQRAAQVEQAVWAFWESEAQGFAQVTPDFGDAAKFLAEQRDQQLSALSSVDRRFATKQARDQQMNTELREIVIAAHRNGVSPAEAVYNMAKAWGYKGAAPAPGADPGKAIAALAGKIEAETTLSGTGGGAAKTAKSAEDIASMSAEEFEAWYAKAGDKGFKRAMSGA